jgi:hypothetical protein
LLVEINIAEDHLVKVVSSTERVIRNKSSDPQSIKNYIHTDEWGYAAGNSQIIDCVMELENETIVAKDHPTSSAYSIRIETKEKVLRPNQTAKFRSKWVEYKYVNDVLFYHFAIPTVDPEIEVRLPPELDCMIGFGASEENIQPYHYTIRKRLVGTYFPHQHMSVRWWPKATGERDRRPR